MLFNSQAFICGFLPIVLALYYACASHRVARQAIVVVASLVFYGWWDVRFVPLLAGLTVANWLIAQLVRCIARQVDPGARRGTEPRRARRCSNMPTSSAAPRTPLLGETFQPWSLILPLGISFFVFQKISYLIDLRRGDRHIYGFLDFCMFVTFFPQLIAGPHRAPQRDHPSVPPRSAPAGDVGEPVARLRAVRDRRGEEGGAGRHAGDGGRSAVRQGGRARRCPRPKPGSPPAPTRCRSISTSPATPTWPSAWR